jgi:hypothetical protein
MKSYLNIQPFSTNSYFGINSYQVSKKLATNIKGRLVQVSKRLRSARNRRKQKSKKSYKFFKQKPTRNKFYYGKHAKTH